MLIELAYQQLLQKLETLYEKREASNIANWVIEHITGLKRMDRLLQKDKLLSVEQTEKLATKTDQLLNSEPVQYVLGEAWFAGNKFYVDPAVLIPRPETEELLEWIKADHAINPYHQILDIGTGSGCIPITLKLRKPFASVLSIDISSEALIIAKKNAASLNANINLMQIDFLKESNWTTLPLFDCIVSNPPYIKESERSSMSKHVTDFEPSLALFVPDNDALIFYRKIAEFGTTHLEKNGAIYLEINQALGNEVISLFQQFGYATELRKDLMANDRMVKVHFAI
jgi:release factor glutamine methyltransferase